MALGITQAALAAPAGLPGIVDPGRVLRDREIPEEPGKYVPPTRVETPSNQPVRIKSGKQFVLRHVVIKGVTAYSEDAFQGLYQSQLGQSIDRAEPDAWVNSIRERYRKDGYIFARVTGRVEAAGNVTISVNEGRVGRVFVEGNSAGIEFLKRIAAPINHSGPPNIKVIERAVLLMNDLPGVTAKSVLHPAGDNAFDVTIMVTPKPAESSVTLDNFGSRYNGPFELTGATSVNGLTSAFSQTSVSGIVTLPPDELQSFQLGHSVPLNANGTLATVQLARVLSVPGYLLARQDVESVSDSVQFQVAHPLIRSRSENLYLTGGFALRNTATDVLKAELSRDRLRIASATAAYDFQDALAGTNQFQLEVGLHFPRFC